VCVCLSDLLRIIENLNTYEKARSTVTVMNRCSCNNSCRINTAVGRTNSDLELNYVFVL
jgi:hypothetical protein